MTRETTFFDDQTEEDHPLNTCADCRHHRVELRPKPIEASFDTVVAFEDEDQRFYFCMAKTGPFAGREVGFEPTTCEVHESPDESREAAKKNQLDLLMARAGARAKKIEDER